jgi:uncharacterized protein YndB with AHSA1/START domain
VACPHRSRAARALTPEASGTRLELIHEGFDLDSPLGRQAFEVMKPGWPGVLKGLEKALEAR